LWPWFALGRRDASMDGGRATDVYPETG
jgi:hypothetical protein